MPLVAAAALAACSDEGPRTPNAIVVTPNVPRVPLGGTLQLTATVVDEEGREVPDEAVAFQSSDHTVLTVSETGLLTSVGPRSSAVITVSSGGVSAEVEAEVVLGPSGLFVSPGSLELESDDEAQLNFVVTDEHGDSVPDAAFVFETSDAAVAVVMPWGAVRAEGPGSATVTVISGEHSLEIPVTVIQVAHSVRITPASLVLEPGGAGQLTAEVLDLGGDPIPGVPLTLSSSDESILTVDATGGIASPGPGGLVTVTASGGGFTGTAKVYVGSVPTGEVASTVQVDGAWKVVMASDDRYLLATQGAELRSGTLPAFGFPVSIPFDGATADIALNADRTLAYVPRAETGGSVLGVGVIDLATDEVIDVIPTTTGGNLFRVALSLDEARFAVSTHLGFEVVDIAGRTTIASDGDGQVDRLVSDPVRPVVYGVRFDGRVVRIDVDGDVTVDQLPFSGAIADIAVSRDGARLYAIESGDAVIHVYNLESQSEEPSLTTAAGSRLVLSPDGELLWVLADQRVTVVEPSEGVVMRQFELGTWLRDVAIADDVAILVDNPGTPMLPTVVHFIR